MSEFYFDVGKWEDDLAKRGGRLMGEEDAGGENEEGPKQKKRKRPSKKDLVCIFFLRIFLVRVRCVEFFIIGSVQRTKKTQEARQNGVVAYLILLALYKSSFGNCCNCLLFYNSVVNSTTVDFFLCLSE